VPGGLNHSYTTRLQHESHAGHSRTNRGPEGLHRSFLVVYHSWWGRDSYVILLSLGGPLECVLIALAFPFSQYCPCSLCNTGSFLWYGGVAGDGLWSSGVLDSTALHTSPHPRAHALSYPPPVIFTGRGSPPTPSPARAVPPSHRSQWGFVLSPGPNAVRIPPLCIMCGVEGRYCRSCGHGLRPESPKDNQATADGLAARSPRSSVTDSAEGETVLASGCRSRVLWGE
jgi:hypothetical protein